MVFAELLRCMPLCCAALMLVACGGGEGTPAAAPVATSGTSVIPEDSGPLCLPGTSDTPVTPSTPDIPSTPSPTPEIPAPAPQTSGRDLGTLSGFPNLGSTCYASSALKFLIRSAEPRRLIEHLTVFANASDAPRSEAATRFIQLIESSYSATGATREALVNFSVSLQKLPAFSSRNTAGGLDFPLVNKQQDVNDFLMRLSESFALGELYGYPIILMDFRNELKANAEYWTILAPATVQDSLQDLFDRTHAADWLVRRGQEPLQLTVAIADGSELGKLGNLNFDFNQSVRLRATDASTGEALVLTLEPREVVEFRGIDDQGHYLIYFKDGQWFRHDDERVQTFARMPAIEQVRMINFAVVTVESGS